jgi:hypothetical protein
MTTAALARFGPHAFSLTGDPAIGPDADVLRDAVENATAPSTSMVYETCLSSPQSTVALFADAVANRKVDIGTLQQAFELVDALPVWAPPPEIEMESDGQIGFDWVFARDCVVSLNVGRAGMVGYASRIGLESSYGRLPFAGVLPERIKDLLRRLVEAGKTGQVH